MKTNLQTGDVFLIKRGMTVYAKIQSRFVYSNRPFSKELALTDIKVGEVLRPASPKASNALSFDTSVFIGAYVVTKTSFSGGGTGHGPHDIYPDGHHVIAKQLDDNRDYDENGLEINFYQSGCFTAMIYAKDIEKVGSKKMTFV